MCSCAAATDTATVYRKNYAGILLHNVLPIVAVFWASDYYRPRPAKEIWERFTPLHIKQAIPKPLAFVAAEDNFEIPTSEGRDFVFRNACFSGKEEASRLKVGSMTSLSVGNDCSQRILLWHSWIYPGGASEAVVVDSFKDSRQFRVVDTEVLQRGFLWYNIRDLGFAKTLFNPFVCLDCSRLPQKEGRRGAADVAFAQARTWLPVVILHLTRAGCSFRMNCAMGSRTFTRDSNRRNPRR
jgi:hypothetical protein